MKLNMTPVSFSGMWFKKGSENGVSKFEYRPFADESPERIQKEVDKFNGKTQIYYPGGFRKNKIETIIEATVGSKLNITTAEFRENLPYGPGFREYPGDEVEIK